MKRNFSGNYIDRRGGMKYPDFSNETSFNESHSKLEEVNYVPWKNQKEWLEVREKIFSPKIEDVEYAVGKISAWNAKCASTIAAGALCTAFLWKVKLRDMKQSEGGFQYDKSEISSLYSMAIIRFVNLISDLGKTAKGGFRLDIAENMNIPGWIVQLRNEAAHSTIPSYQRLKKGTDICLDWLRLNYWEKEENNLMDYGKGKVSLCTDIGNEDETIRTYLQEFEKDHFDFIYSRRKRVRFQIFFKLTQMQYMFNLNIDRFTSILTESGFLILRYHQLDAILKSEEKDYLNNESVCLPRSLERFWFPVLEIYNTNPDSYNQLITALLTKRQDQLEQRLATSWALHLLEISVNSDKSDLKVPSFLQWKDLLAVALKNPHKYCTSVLKVIAEKVQIHQDVKNCLMGLVAIQLGALVGATNLGDILSKKGKKKQLKIYTVEDLKRQIDRRLRIKHEIPRGPWSIAQDDVDWKKIPLGISPDDIEMEANLAREQKSHSIQITEIVDEPDPSATSEKYMQLKDQSYEEEMEPEQIYDIEENEVNEKTNEEPIVASKSVFIL